MYVIIYPQRTDLATKVRVVESVCFPFCVTFLAGAFDSLLQQHSSDSDRAALPSGAHVNELFGQPHGLMFHDQPRSHNPLFQTVAFSASSYPYGRP